MSGFGCFNILLLHANVVDKALVLPDCQPWESWLVHLPVHALCVHLSSNDKLI